MFEVVTSFFDIVKLFVVCLCFKFCKVAFFKVMLNSLLIFCRFL